MSMFPIWDNFTSGILEYGLLAYSSIEPWTIPFVLLGIVGFVYAFTQSITVGIIAILITFGAYAGTNIFAETPDISIFLYIVAILGISLLLTVLFIKRR